MSWITKIKDSLVIQTGDGEEYRPGWVNASKSKEYNVSEFEFVKIPGTLVDRRLPKGRRYTLEVHFQGDDHLDVAEAFDRSADNLKYWRLKHPFYGIILVQPLSINQDNSALNISKFTIPIVETIVDEVTRGNTDPIDSISVTKVNLDEAFAGSITATITPTDINSIKATNKKNYDLSVPIIKLPEEFQTYFNAFNQAQTAVDTATVTPMLGMQATINLITAPANFASGVRSRTDLLNNQFNLLRATVTGALTVSSKQVYQTLGGSIISSMCLAASLPIDNDYSNTRKAEDIISIINNSYNLFLSDLDSLQSNNGGSPYSFIPDFDSLLGLNELINITITYLYNAVLGARRERSIICEYDTNIVNLTHRLYGLDNEDKNIQELIDNNELHVRELIQIKKGRKIIYYL